MARPPRPSHPPSWMRHEIPIPAATRNVWCTELDLGDERPETLVAPRIPEFDSVRVLLRLHGEPLQFAERELVNGQVATDDLLRGLNDSARARLIAHLELDGAARCGRHRGFRAPARHSRAVPPTRATQRTVTVVVCTRGRGQELRGCLCGAVHDEQSGLEFVIVDNAPVDHHTESASPPRSGTIRASATSSNHDQVCPAPAIAGWPRRPARSSRSPTTTSSSTVLGQRLLADSTVGPDVACVTSLVCTAALHTPGEHYFDARVSWASRCEPRVYDQTAPDSDGLYPYAPAFRHWRRDGVSTEVIRELCGFDEHWAPAPAPAAARTSMRLSGSCCRAPPAYEPGSVVWHHHRWTWTPFAGRCTSTDRD